MSDISILASLQDVVDMALGSPELGAVNFNLLNTVMQFMMKQLKLNDRYVQIKGPDDESIRKLMGSTHPKLPVKFAKYDPIHGLREFPLNTPRSSLESEVIPRNWQICALEQPSSITTDTVRQPEVIVPVSDERFFSLESDMKDLKNKMEQILNLPNDANILRAMRPLEVTDVDHTNTLTPVRDMWQLLSLRKRVDATEAGLDNLTETLDAFMTEIIETLYSVSNIKLNTSLIDESRTRTMTLRRKQSVESKEPFARPSVYDNLVQRLDDIERTLENLPSNFSHLVESSQSTARMSRSEELQADYIINLAEQVETQKEIVENLEKDMIGALKSINELCHFEEMFTDLKKMKTNVINLAEEQEALLRTLNDNLQVISDHKAHIDEIQTNMALMQEKLNSTLECETLPAKPSKQTFDSSISTLSNKVISVERTLQEIPAIAQQFTQELREIKMATNVLTGQMEAINHLKANKVDVTIALTEKADVENMIKHLKEKVPQEQFETVYRKLKSNIAEVMTKLAEQENLWSLTLERIQTAVKNKINKIDELESLHHCFNEKIKSLKRRLKCIETSKEQQEAAATKSKLLKDVNCITCDKPVVMKKVNEHSLFPSPPLVPGKPSMKPYHTYQLDSVRKQEKCLTENTPRQKKTRKEEDTSNSPRSSHQLTRFYGGKHTVTSAQERVTRVGNFLDQWGPRILPLNETYLQGTDGKVYKSREPADTCPRRDNYKLTVITQSCTVEPSKGITVEQTLETSTSDDDTSNNRFTRRFTDSLTLLREKRAVYSQTRRAAASSNTSPRSQQPSLSGTRNNRNEPTRRSVMPRSILKKTLASGDFPEPINNKRVRFSKSTLRFGQ